MGSLPAVTNVAVLTALLGLTLLLHPSVQFTLLHKPTAQRAGAGPPLDQDAISAHTNLVTRDNAPIQARPPPPHTAPSSPPASDSTPLAIPPLAHTTITRPANSRKTNREENFRTSHRLGETPTESLGKAEEGVKVVGKGNKRERGGSAGLSRASSLLEHKQAAVVVRGASRSSGKRRQQTHVSDKTTTALHNQNNNQDIPFTQVVQVEVDSDPHHAAESGLRVDTGSAGIADSETGVPVLSGGRQKAAAVVLEVEEEEGESQLLQQAVAHRTGDPHVSKMVLTAIGSLTAILGVCVMAAIFQCCCRRKRSTSSPDVGQRGGEGEEVVEGGEEKKELKPKTNGSQGRASKSPSPHKAVLARAEEEEEEAEKGCVSEKDSLLEENRKEAQQDEDNDLGDFSMVQRETSILRSYRKPPPPKNRARASRVPRALKGVDPKASPTLFQELVKNEQTDNNASETPPKSTKGLASPDAAAASPDMQSSMLADIDSTLAALHNKQDTPSPPKSAQQSRETSVEKVTAKSGGSDDSQLKTPVKPSLPASPSREKLAKALAQELTRSVSKEMLATKQPQSRQSTPSKGSKETSPKSESAGASPKPVHSQKDVSGSSSKDSVGLNSDGASSSDSRSGQSEEGDNKKKPGNIFALIDPTTKDKGDKDKGDKDKGDKDKGDKDNGDKDKGDKDKDDDAGAKSKIPVRAASSPTQPKAPLRLSSGKDKRFPVPSVHGDQMEQLMKSLKTRLKEDDGDSPKKVSNNKVSPEEASAEDDDLDPMGRDRSHSDPTKQAEERGKKLHQSHV